MATKYRTSVSETAAPGFAPKRWQLLILFPVAVAIALGIIAGNFTGDALASALHVAFTIPVLLPAAMLGTLITQPLSRGKLFEKSPWPDAFRLVIGTALGLGAISIATLLLGSMGLLHSGIPLAIPIAAASAGFFSTRAFVKNFDLAPIRAPATRGDLLLLIAAVPIAVLVIACAFPPESLWMSEGYAYDVRSYHLPAPREYLAAGSTAPLHHNVYSYLPGNIEMLYLQLMCFAQLVDPGPECFLAIYPAQYLHAIIMFLAALVVFLAPLSITRIGRILALLAFVGTPWVLITGSVAYNEAGLMLFGSIALALVFAPPSRAATIAIGVSLGLAVGCKLTAGTMFAVPVGILLLSQKRIVPAAFVTLIALVVFSPWALRAAAGTGNPVFPLATSLFGRGHWTEAQAKRWEIAHAATPDHAGVSGRFAALAEESVVDPYWSYFSLQSATFDNETGRVLSVEARASRNRPGMLWIAFALAFALAITRGPQAWLLLAALGIQLICWLTLTHLQARFLLPTLTPIAWIIAFGAAPLALPRAVAALLLAIHCATTSFLFLPDWGLFFKCRINLGEVFGQIPVHAPMPPDNEKLDPNRSAVYLVGDATPLLYRGKVYYSTVFDNNQLIAVFREKGPDAARAFLDEKKIAFLGINRGEIARFANTYGFEANQNAIRNPEQAKKYRDELLDALQPLLKDLKPIQDGGTFGTQMYYIPPKK
jgi:hypothetical protein